MIPREIHDPKVLIMIAREASWMKRRCLGRLASKAYGNLSDAAVALALEINRPVEKRKKQKHNPKVKNETT